jgi:hypothetical protein
MPGDHGLGLDDDDGAAPPAPDLGKPAPENAICSGQTQPPRTCAFQDGQLVPQRQNLEL